MEVELNYKERKMSFPDCFTESFKLFTKICSHPIGLLAILTINVSRRMNQVFLLSSYKGTMASGDTIFGCM